MDLVVAHLLPGGGKLTAGVLVKIHGFPLADVDALRMVEGFNVFAIAEIECIVVVQACRGQTHISKRVPSNFEVPVVKFNDPRVCKHRPHFPTVRKCSGSVARHSHNVTSLPSIVSIRVHKTQRGFPDLPSASDMYEAEVDMEEPKLRCSLPAESLCLLA